MKTKRYNVAYITFMVLFVLVGLWTIMSFGNVISSNSVPGAAVHLQGWNLFKIIFG